MTPNERLKAVHEAVLGLCQAEFGKGKGGLRVYIEAVQTELECMKIAAKACGV